MNELKNIHFKFIDDTLYSSGTESKDYFLFQLVFWKDKSTKSMRLSSMEWKRKRRLSYSEN